ncbi:hypothetical protein D3C81_1221250 [compost metagenome]
MRAYPGRHIHRQRHGAEAAEVLTHHQCHTAQQAVVARLGFAQCQWQHPLEAAPAEHDRDRKLRVVLTDGDLPALVHRAAGLLRLPAQCRQNATGRALHIIEAIFPSDDRQIRQQGIGGQWQLDGVVRPLAAHQHHALQARPMSTDRGQRQMRAVAHAPQADARQVHRAAQVLDVVGALSGGVGGQIDAGLPPFGDAVGGGCAQCDQRGVALQWLGVVDGMRLRALRRHLRKIRAALVEQQYIGLATDAVEYRPTRPKRGTEAGTAGTTGQIHHRRSMTVTTGSGQAHHAQTDARAIRFAVPARHFQESFLGRDRAVALGFHGVRREHQRCRCVARQRWYCTGQCKAHHRQLAGQWKAPRHVCDGCAIAQP